MELPKQALLKILEQRMSMDIMMSCLLLITRFLNTDGVSLLGNEAARDAMSALSQLKQIITRRLEAQRVEECIKSRGDSLV